MGGPLDGIRIVDFTTMISGPLATMILAEQGAEVVKIERPRGGDHSRQVAGSRGGMTASFLNNNRGKRSVTLDLKDPRGRDAARALCRDADVVVQNFRPGAADRLGLGEAAVRETNAAVVYVSIAGFGFEGDWAARPVYDPLVQALSGLAAVQGGESGRPRLVRTILPDKVTAIQASQAITAALLGRARTGEGSHVRLSMLDTVVAFLWSSDMAGQTFVGDEEAGRPLDPDVPAQDYIELIYRTGDGFMAVSAHTDKTWAGLARAAGRPDWLEDPRFATVAGRETHKAARLALTQEALLQDTTDEWMARLVAEDVPCAPALSRAEMIRHPQIVANGILTERHHPQAGRIRQPRHPARFGAGPADEPRPAPRLGEDTRWALGRAGLDPAEIEALIEAGVATGPQEGET